MKINFFHYALCWNHNSLDLKYRSINFATLINKFHFIKSPPYLILVILPILRKTESHCRNDLSSKLSKNTVLKSFIVYQNFFMIKLCKSSSLRPVTSLRISLVGTLNILALVLEAYLVEWAVKDFVSMPARPSTSIIQRDTVELEIALWESRERNKSCNSFLWYSFVLSIYRSIWWQTQLLIST